MRRIQWVIFCLLSFGVNAEEYVSFFGKAIEQKHLRDVQVACPEGHICMDVVFQWSIRVGKVVSGELSGQTVRAARIQHAEFIYAHKHEALYVLSRIKDEAKRKLLGADYWLEEYVPPSTLYCMSPERNYGIEENDSISLHSATSSCYVKHDDT